MLVAEDNYQEENLEEKEARLDSKTRESIKEMDACFSDALSECDVNDGLISVLFTLIDEGVSNERIGAILKARQMAVFSWIKEAHDE